MPDAVGVFRGVRDDVQYAVAFEVDRGTENVSWFVRRKTYAEARSAGQPLAGCADWCVCCVVPSERRRNKLVAGLWGAGIPEGLWYFSVAADITPRAILGPIWLTPRVGPDGESATLVPESPFEAVISNCHRGHDGLATTSVRSSANLADAEGAE